MFIVALFTPAKIWQQPKCPSTDVPLSISLSLSHIHTQKHRGMLPSHKKGGDLAICNNVDVPRGYYAK